MRRFCVHAKIQGMARSVLMEGSLRRRAGREPGGGNGCGGGNGARECGHEYNHMKWGDGTCGLYTRGVGRSVLHAQMTLGPTTRLLRYDVTFLAPPFPLFPFAAPTDV